MVSRWSLRRVSPDDPSLASDDEPADLSTRLTQRTAELREARSDQAAAWDRLSRAEDKAATLGWQLGVIKASRSHRLIRLVQQARSARALVRIPQNGLRVLTTAVAPPPRPPDSSHRGRAEHTRGGWAAYDRRDYETALAEASTVLADHPKDYAALDLKQSAHWQRGDIAATVSALSQMRMVHDSPQVALRERTIIGCARELDPRWLPRVPGPPTPADPRDGVVMHLASESIPDQASGSVMRGRDTVACQRRAGLDPFVVTSLGFPRPSGVTSFPPVEIIDGTTYHRLDAGPDYPLYQANDVLLSDTAWLAGRIGRQQRPSVIHAVTGSRGFETALVGLALREHLGRPLVYEARSVQETTRTQGTALPQRGEHYEARRAAETRCMQAADLVVTVSDETRSEIIERGIPERRVFVVPTGVDSDRFAPGEPSAALRKQHGLDGKTVIGCLSNLDEPGPGQQILIEATARLRAAGRDVVCLLVGDGKHREELAEQARRAGAGSVIFTGQVADEQVRDYCLLMDVFVVPGTDDAAARMETPVTPLQAMALGLPLVVSDSPALTGLATPDERGLAFMPGDPQALARAIEALLDDPDRARRLAAEGRRWVLAERSWAANGQRYRDIYGQLLDQSATSEHTQAGLS
jgi:glycosyltransferase involved in cell wall biosynthesis